MEINKKFRDDLDMAQDFYTGNIQEINNRKIAKLAKLSGAPQSKSAGISMNVRLGDEIEKGELLYILHAETNGELNYALEYYENHDDIITIQ